MNTGEKQDRMHSFAVAETLPVGPGTLIQQSMGADLTLQYLYLLFDESNALNHGSSNGVFTTEGHYLSLDKKYLKPPPKSRKGEAQVCAAYDPAREAYVSRNASRSGHSLQLGIPYRKDREYARTLVGHQLDEQEAIATGLWLETSYCESPAAQVMKRTSRLAMTFSLTTNITVM